MWFCGAWITYSSPIWSISISMAQTEGEVITFHFRQKAEMLARFNTEVLHTVSHYKCYIKNSVDHLAHNSTGNNSLNWFHAILGKLVKPVNGVFILYFNISAIKLLITVPSWSRPVKYLHSHPPVVTLRWSNMNGILFVQATHFHILYVTRFS